MSDKLQGGIVAGSTSVSLPIILRKTADNTEQTGTVAAGVTAYYWRQGGTPTALTTPSDLAAITSAFAAGGWKAADGTNAPGVYRLDVDNAAFAGGADWVVITVKVANCYLFVEKYPLTSNVVQSGDSYARLGAPAGASVSADIAAVKANTATLVAGVNVTQWNGHATPAENIAGVPLVDCKYLLGTILATPAIAGLMDVNVKNYNNHAAVTDSNNFPKVDVEAWVAAIPAGLTNGYVGANILEWNSGAVPPTNVTGVPLVDLKYTLGTISAGAAGYVALDWAHMTGQATAQNLSATTINLCNTLTTYTGNTPQTGDSYARLGAPAGASVSADIAAIKANTATLVTGVTVSAYAAGQDPATLVWAQSMVELSAVPSVTDTILHALEWVFIVSHNKITETATTQTVRNNADAVTIGTSTISDDGTTFIRGKYS